ncbi:Fe(2+)-trafficking protein [Vibrio lentus]|nr:Fe(2+)-trafficking protein [Vibrio lentus]
MLAFKDAEGLDFQLYPGDLGKALSLTTSLKKLRDNGKASKPCLSMRKLNMMDPEHRKLLKTEMVNFLFRKVKMSLLSGYTPPKRIRHLFKSKF